MAIRAVDCDGQLIKVGDVVGFKYDVEQTSVVKAVNEYGEVLVEVTEGGYSHGPLWEKSDRCWKLSE